MMKFTTTALLLALTASTQAFAPTKRVVTRSARFSTVTEEPKVEGKVNGATEAKKEPTPTASTFFLENNSKPLEPGRYDNVDYSITLPFWKRPKNLDGSHAGDYGFDPMGLSEEFDLFYMQECEVRHARLAMLAVVGWPLSELVAPSFMLQDGRAPSVLNGFNPLSFLVVLGAFAAFGLFEFTTSLRRTSDTELGKVHLKDMQKIWENCGVAGDYNFDPLNLYNSLGDDAYGRKAMREMEITQGRYAMLGITYFALWEAVSGQPIVENNMFFHPNIVLPVLGVAWTVVSTLYEFADLREGLQIQKSKLGKEFDEWVERRRDAP